MKNWLIKKLGGEVKNATMKEPEWWRQSLLGNNVASGVSVNEDTAMQVSAVYGCVRILAETIASLPLNVYRRDGESKVIDTSHPLHSILHDAPNNIQTSYELREFQVSNLGLRGNSFNQVLRSGRGAIGEIIPLYSQYAKPRTTADNKLVIDYQEPGNNRVFQQSEIWRTAGLSSNGVTGLSPVSLARESIGLSIATEQHGAYLFSNGAQVPAVLEHPQILNDEAFKHLKESFDDKHTGVGNSHKPLILEQGMTYKSIGMTSEDSQFLESRKFQIAEIARWYRVPLHMLNELTNATFSNIEHQSIEFVMHTIRPWLVRIEQSINRDLFLPSERGRYFVEHNIEGLLRGDTLSRYEAYGKGINDGWLNPNEVRKFENLDPVDGLDDYRFPLNMGAQDETQSTENMNNSIAAEMVEKEISAVKFEAFNKSPDEFKAWAVKFYDRHLTKAAELMNSDAAKFTDYAVSHINELTESQNINGTFDRWRENAPKDLIRLSK